MERADDKRGWLAFGITLHLLPAEESGRRRPVGTHPYVRFSYRPMWQLPGMTAEWTDAFVLHLANTPLALGETARAVIVPAAPRSLPMWQAVKVGDELRMFEGARLCGVATVAWRAPTGRPPPAGDEQRFIAWTEGAAGEP